jgi:hypothetical protein
MLLNQLFEFGLEHNSTDRETLILSLVGYDETTVKNLPLLNSLLDIKLPLKPEHEQLTDGQQLEKMVSTVKVV